MKMRRHRLMSAAVAAGTIVAALGAAGSPAAALRSAEVEGCAVFPADNPWNQRIDRLPVAPRSRAMVRSIGLNEGLHPDFGSGLWDGGPIGIPFVTVGAAQEEVPIRYTAYGDESDPGPFPIPPDAPVEGGADATGDRHVVVVDRDACRLFELFSAFPVDGGASWDAASGATWDLTSNALRPRGQTSADAAGLPILPGLARYDEVAAGSIDHALRFTVERSRRKFIYPARHFASSLTSRRLPAMGQRFRLKRGFDISGFPPQARVVLRALKRYGMIVADNGSDWFISGAPDEGWDNDDLHTLGLVEGRFFEVVDTSALPRPPAP